MSRPARTVRRSGPADHASLHYATDARPGIRRRRAGRGFSYRGPDGRRIADAERLRWIRGLAVPPAWTDVWISPDPRGHLLATGRDARGRKQYRYHPEFRRRRDELKFDRLAAFGRRLPRLRRRIDADLARPGLPRDKVLAAVVALMDATAIRVGNEAYARDNGSYGATTLRSRQASVAADAVRLTFRGKSGRTHRIRLRNRRLARVVRRCQELPGQPLFQYETESGDWAEVRSEDVNDYLRAVVGEEFSAKDLRTWRATVTAFEALEASNRPTSAERDAHRRDPAVVAVEAAAERLGNTPAVVRSAYVHPAVLDRPVRRRRPRRSSRWRSAAEAELLDFLGR